MRVRRRRDAGTDGFRIRRWLVGPGTAAVALLLLCSPMAASASVAPNASGLGHISVQTSRNIATSGCHHLSDSNPRLHRATGVATWQAKALSVTCSKGFQGPGPADEATVQVGIEVAIPVKPLSGRGVFTTVQLQWNISALGNITTMLSAPCPNVLVNASSGDGNQFCELAAYAGITLDAYLYDETNGTTFYPNSAPAGIQVYSDTTNSTTCFDYVCYGSNSTATSSTTSFSSPFTDRIDLQGYLDHSHHYEVITTLTAFVETLVAGYPGHGRAAAQLTLASGGVGTSLGGVSVS